MTVRRLMGLPHYKIIHRSISKYDWGLFFETNYQKHLKLLAILFKKRSENRWYVFIK